MGGDHLGSGHPVLVDERQAVFADELVLHHHLATLPQRVLGIGAGGSVVQRTADQLDGVGSIGPERGYG